MTNATLNGKPYAGNPHVRFEVGGSRIGKPRRGSLLYMRVLTPGFLAACVLGACHGDEVASAAEVAQMQANPVPAIGQNAEDMVALTTTGGLRVLFMGNSITLHGPRPQIGWTNNWGMAATAPDKDYVHVLADLIKTRHPDASFGLIQVASKIEMRLNDIDLKPFKWAREWKPDVITLFYGANCNKQYDGRPYDGRFTKATEKVLDYIDPEHKAKVFQAEGFYIRPAIDWEKRLMAGRRGEVFVPMDDLRRRKDTHGRYNHPGDLGMKLIAERFWEYIEPELAGADGVRTGDYDVRTYGAKGDGVVKDTAALQKAIDACSAAGGGRVVLTPGTYLTGALRVKSGVELHLQRKARLLASPDMEDFPDWTEVEHVTTSSLPRGRNACVLFADEAHDIAITGFGVIDGNGEHHVEPEPADHRGWPFRRRLPMEKTLPRVVFFTGCRNVTVKDVTLVNPPAGWSYWIHDCDRVSFRDCRIEADVRYPNNDGIHVNCSRDVEIANCDITTGDDAIVVRANSRSLAADRACERVTVSNCVLRSWSAGVRLGWTNDGTIRDCRFTDLTMRDTSVGVAYVLPGVHGSDYGREATTLENILFENIEMNGICGRPVLVKFAPATQGTKVGAISNVVFRQVTCRGLERPLVIGRPGYSLAGLSFEDCRFELINETEMSDYRRHGAAAWDRNVTLDLTAGDFRIRDPFVVTDETNGIYRLYSSIYAGKDEAADDFGNTGKGVEMYISEDLKTWAGPTTVLELPDDLGCTAVWAPEVHEFSGRWYLFVTLTFDKQKLPPHPGWRDHVKRGTWIFAADRPEGPFRIVKRDSVTPRDWSALDGTLVVEDGKPYMVFCHEWNQVGDGEMCLMPLNDDLSDAAGEPVTLFKASAAPDVRADCRVTDGPSFFRDNKSGDLLMIWSTVRTNGAYCVYWSKSETGRVTGPWTKHTMLFDKNGGHGMLFRKLPKMWEPRFPMLALHQPNSPRGAERMKIFELEYRRGVLTMRPPRLTPPKPRIPSLPPQLPSVVTAGGQRRLLSEFPDLKVTWDGKTFAGNCPGWTLVNYPLSDEAKKSAEWDAEKKNWYVKIPGKARPEPPPATGPAPIALHERPTRIVDANDPNADYRTIGSALKGVKPGDVIRVKPGIYRESIEYVAKCGAVDGTAERPIVIEGERGADGRMPVVSGNRAFPANAWRKTSWPGVWRADAFTDMEGAVSCDGEGLVERTLPGALQPGECCFNRGGRAFAMPVEKPAYLRTMTADKDGNFDLSDPAFPKGCVVRASCWVWVKPGTYKAFTTVWSKEAPVPVSTEAKVKGAWRAARQSGSRISRQSNRYRVKTDGQWVGAYVYAIAPNDENRLPVAHIDYGPKGDSIRNFRLPEGWSELAFEFDSSLQPEAADFAFFCPKGIGTWAVRAEKPSDLAEKPRAEELTDHLTVLRATAAEAPGEPDRGVYVRLRDDNDPNAHTMDLAQWGQLFGTDRSFVHVRGLEFRHGAQSQQQAQASMSGQGGLFEGCQSTESRIKGFSMGCATDQEAAPNVIRNCWAVRPGNVGFGAASPSRDPRLTEENQNTTSDSRGRFILEYSTAIDNNWGAHKAFWESGSVKCVNMTGAIFRYNNFYGGYGPGIWLDWQNMNNRLEGNYFTNGWAFAVGIEASAGPNLVCNNRVVDQRAGSQWFRHSFLAWSSARTWVVYNEADGRNNRVTNDQGEVGAGPVHLEEGPDDRGTRWEPIGNWGKRGNVTAHNRFRNYVLKADSPEDSALDKTIADLVTLDFYGLPRTK